MAIRKKWSYYSKENIKKIPSWYIGTYEIGHQSSNKILYIGEGKLRARLLAHFPDGRRNEETVVGADAFRFLITNQKHIAVQNQNQHLRSFNEKYKKLPKFNSKSKN